MKCGCTPHTSQSNYKLQTNAHLRRHALTHSVIHCATGGLGLAQGPSPTNPLFHHVPLGAEACPRPKAPAPQIHCSAKGWGLPKAPAQRTKHQWVGRGLPNKSIGLQGTRACPRPQPNQCSSGAPCPSHHTKPNHTTRHAITRDRTTSHHSTPPHTTSPHPTP